MNMLISFIEKKFEERKKNKEKFYKIEKEIKNFINSGPCKTQYDTVNNYYRYVYQYGEDYSNCYNGVLDKFKFYIKNKDNYKNL